MGFEISDFLPVFVLETLLVVIECWQNPSILQRKRTDVPSAVSEQKKHKAVVRVHPWTAWKC